MTIRWNQQAYVHLPGGRGVNVEQSTLGEHRARPVGDWTSLRGNGSTPQLALDDLAKQFEYLAQRIRDGK